MLPVIRVRISHNANVELKTAKQLLPAFQALSDEMKELAQMLHNTCVAETGVNEGILIKRPTNQLASIWRHF